LFPPLDGRHRKSERKARMVARAREDLAAWAASVGATLHPLAPPAEAVTAAGEASPPVRTLVVESDTVRRPMDPAR
ncbi:MAG: hypothetical protein ACJ79O_05720, partial [Myxococcales bacterium]